MSIREELAGPFIEAAGVALRELAGVESAPQEPYRAASEDAFGDISAILTLTAGSAGCLVVSFPATTANAIARNVLREVTEEPEPELIRDCAGEIANVIAGQAKALLTDTHHHFTFSPPSIVEGPCRPPRHRLIIPLMTDVGPLTLQLCFGEE